MFVNVADIPSYWAYNPYLRRKLDITAAVCATFPTATGIHVIFTKPFELTPLVKALGLRVAGINQGFPQNLNQVLGPGIHVSVTSKRAAIVESNLDSCIPPTRLRYIDGNVYDMSALFFVKYDEGDFLLSLIWINNSAHNQQAKDAIRDAISKLTIDKIASKVKNKILH